MFLLAMRGFVGLRNFWSEFFLFVWRCLEVFGEGEWKGLKASKEDKTKLTNPKD